LMRGVAFGLRPNAVKRSGAGVRGVIPQIGFDGPETEHVDPAIQARYDRDDVDRVHVVRDGATGTKTRTCSLSVSIAAEMRPTPQ
jgi:hypothetical protein